MLVPNYKNQRYETQNRKRYDGRSSSAHPYYGARTRRGIDNFKIASDINRMPLEVIRAFAYLKKAAALTNQEAGVLPAGKCSLFAQVCDEILKRELDDSFPLVVWRTGNGTQSDMNVNEVIANRAHVLNGGKLTDKEKILLPNNDINESQSSNDTFPGIRKLRDTLTAKSKEFMDVVKIGRTHFIYGCNTPYVVRAGV